MVATFLGLSFAVGAPAFAKNKEGGKPMTLEEAINDAETALDSGRVGDAISHVEKLQRTHGLKPDELRRLDLIVARCGLVTGKYDTSEKIFAKLHKAQPDDARVSEWYGRALDGLGKAEEALTVLAGLAAKNELQDGDSYWALAQLEKAKGDDKDALTHAKLALEKPIVLQSDELDGAIHKFIDALSKKQSKGDNK
jgi:tetratricopeptide (TPR) repeat protein